MSEVLRIALCSCEEIQHPHSPSKIEDGEKLGRILIYPKHVDRNGKFIPQAFPITDLRERLLSLQRLNLVTADDLRRKAAAMAGKPTEEIAGMGVARCADIRAIRDTGDDRVFCVGDFARECDPAHAGIIRTNNQGRGELRGYREKLKTIFGPIQKIS